MKTEKLYKKSIVIGLTGPTGAGKTTAASAMSDLGCIVIDADEISRIIMKTNEKCINEVYDCFGNSIKRKNENINRVELSKIAFSSKENVNKLNNITHPYILKEIRSKLKSINESTNNDIIVIDAPLLFETGLYKNCDITVAVITSYDLRLKRIMRRDSLTENMAQSRMIMQNNNDFYKINCDYTLSGENRECDLYRETQELITHLREINNV